MNNALSMIEARRNWRLLFQETGNRIGRNRGFKTEAEAATNIIKAQEFDGVANLYTLGHTKPGEIVLGLNKINIGRSAGTII